MKTVSSLILAGALAFGPVFAGAQVVPPRAGGGRQRMQLERQIQVRFQQTLKTRLGLSDDQVQAMETVMQSFQSDRQALGMAQASLRHRLQDPALSTIGDEEASVLLQEMVQLQERELDLYRREQEQLLVHLTASQLLGFYSLREDMGRRVQELRQGRGGGVGGPDSLAPGRRGGGGGGGPPIH